MFNTVLDYRGYKIYDVEHSLSRFYERVKNNQKIIYERLLKRAINYLIDNNLTNIEEKYVFRSSVYGFGIQVDWKRNLNSPRKEFAGFTATTLSEKEMNYYKYDDKEIFLESIQRRFPDTPRKEILEYLDDIKYLKNVQLKEEAQYIMEKYGYFKKENKLNFKIIDL